MEKVIFTIGAAAAVLLVACAGAGCLHLAHCVSQYPMIAIPAEGTGIVLLFWAYRSFGRLEEDLVRE